jgi:dolichyl-diphosphooligosaccharide--protein glycosyltransferase
VAILLASFGISFAIRTVWSYPIIAQWGSLYSYAGGSDSYYHSRVMTYIIQNHQNLVFDPLLHYPFGGINPREPLFDWMNAVLGIVFAPLFGGNAVVAGAWFLDLQAPLWAAFGVFPVYLIGREVASRRTGLIAAVIFPFLSANIDSSIFGYANYLPFYTFIILVTIYSYIRTVKAVGNRRWVESYRHPRQYWPALRGFLRTERTAVKWAVFTGVSLGTLALAWQGYTYAVAVIGVSVFIAMIAERIRRVDSFGLYVATWITGLVGFPMAMPYYLAQHQFGTWFDLPLLLYFGVLALLLPFLFMRDVPWVFSIPVLAGLVLVAAGGLAILSPVYFHNIVTGQGYFVKNLIYSTVAEAQAPSIDALVVGYGVVTFFLAFVGLALIGYELVHGRFKRYHIVFVVFAVLSVYLPISAAKFFLLGSPIFALLPAEALRRALDLGGYPELRRTVSSLSDRRSQLGAFRKAFKARHVLVMFLIVGLLLPNIWISIDAGIPGNSKTQFADQVAATIPSWLQPNTTNAASYYFGAAGSTIDTSNQYDSAGYNWLAEQDTNLPPSERPAFISWWDYGFQAIDQGQHPSVADNFQNGIDPSGQFLLSQNESQAIAVLTTTILQAEARATGQAYLPARLNQILAADGLNVSELHTLFVNTSRDYSLVVANPDRYLPVNPNTITDDNAMYLAMAYFLASSLPLSGVAKVYNDVQAYTGWTIRYAMVDSRLFPFSGTDTGIYYAPADLTGRIINGAGLPVTFFNVTILGSNGNSYSAGQLPAGVSAVNYYVNYFTPFYNSFIYHVYIGYNGTDVGLGPGIPGLEGGSSLLSSPLMPGWMLQHFQVVYKTAYYCPQKNAVSGSSCYGAMNQPEAIAKAAATHGSADTTPGSYFGGGETMLEYYPGQTLLGDVVLPSGTPVSGARVTVFDQWGIPHMTAFTQADGSFSVVLPPGNDTVNVTMGTFDALYQQGDTVLKTLSIDVPAAVGLSYAAPSLVETVQLAPASVQGFVYWNANNSSSFVPPEDTVVPGAQVVLWGPNGLPRLTATTDASGSFDLTNVPPGVYNYNVLYEGTNYTEPAVNATPGAAANATVGLTPGVLHGLVITPSVTAVAGATVTVSNATGVVATNVSSTSGRYEIRALVPGNYTVMASGPTVGYRSPGVSVTVASPGSNVSANLTVEPMSSVTFQLLANGAPAIGIPVRFDPTVLYANSSSPPLEALDSAGSNGTVVVSSSTGTVTATLPAGTYSVYALGYVGGTLYSGLSTVAVGAGLSNVAAPLTLAAASRLTGTVTQGSAPAGSTRTAVVAYAPSGAELVTWAATNGSFSAMLPQGSYSLLSLTGPPSATSAGLSSALSSATVGPSTPPVELVPGGTIASSFSVGTPLSDGTVFPASSAEVTVSAGPQGPAIPQLASASGTVTFFVPSTLPGGVSYCVAGEARGFVSGSECGVSPSGLAQMSSFPLALQNVSVQLTIVGLPSGTSVAVNFTAESATAVSQTFYGGPTFQFSSRPGLYGVGARAVIGNGTVVYLPSSVLSTTIPVGATRSNLTLVLLPQVMGKGTLHLSPSVPLASVTVALSSPFLNETVNGTAFTSGFRVAPGTYSVRANFSQAGQNYTNLTRLVVSATGAITPTLVVSQPGVSVIGTLASSSGTKVLLNTTVKLVGPGGSSASTTATSGVFSVTLPPGASYAVFANATLLTPGPNGSFYQSWSVSPGASCVFEPTVATCAVRVVPTTELEWLNGTLSSPGVPGPVSGSVELVGPYPSVNVTTVSAPSGTFAERVLPGAYAVYALGSGSGAGRAALSSALALPGNTAPLSLSLLPTWVVTVSFGPPGGSFAGVGPVTFVLQDSAGDRLVYSGLAPTSTLALALPDGSYQLSASAPGSTYGVPTNATASLKVVVGQGNVAALLPLHYPVSYAVEGTLVGPSSATVEDGGVASFAFSVRATGTVPAAIHPVGTPSYWTFNFSFANATLTPGPSGSALSGEVVVHVPSGTAVSYPGVTLEFALANGTVVGQVSPAPTLQIVPYFGIALGASSPSSSQVGPTEVLQSFYVTDTGNTAETVALSIVDGSRLLGLGWSSEIQSLERTATSTVHLSAGENQSLYVELNTTERVFVAPGSVTVSATVLDSNGSLSATQTIPVPYAALLPHVPPGSPAVTVTGPSIGTPPAWPSWLVPVLVFVPAIALAVGLLSYRWWRTRRWTRR